MKIQFVEDIAEFT